MNDRIKKEQAARRFLKKVTNFSSNNPSFFVYHMIKTGKGKMIDKLDALDLKSKDAHDLVDNYLKALKALENKVSEVATMCNFVDEEYSAFISSTIANPLYFVPIDRIDEKTLAKTAKKNLTIEQLTKQLNLNPAMFNIKVTSVDSCLED